MSSKPVLFVSFSGGRTSAYMAYWMLNNLADKYELVFVFANTGQEHEETLRFVNECDKAWSLGVVWIEAVIHKGERKGCTHKIVSYETAARKGEPFEAVIEKYGIPNPDYPHCNRELKLNPIFSYKRSLGLKTSHKMAIGIRSDEMDRMAGDTSDTGAFYPLISMNPTTKEEVRHWWAEQDFDLNIPEHMGNCVTCWKKSDRKLMTIAKHEVERFEFFARMESEHKDTGAGDAQRVFFRKHKTALDIIATSKTPFVEFADHMPELQLDMLGFDINTLDIEASCGASCEL